MDDAVKQAGKNRLLQAKLQRKQAEADAQLPGHRAGVASLSAPPMTTRCKLLFGATYARRFATPPAPAPEGKQICSTGVYEFEYSEQVHHAPGPKSWDDVKRLPCIYLNFGGDVNRHSIDRNYANYVSIQGSSTSGGWGCAVNDVSKTEECGEWCVQCDM